MDNILILNKNDLRELLKEMIPAQSEQPAPVKEADEEVLYTIDEVAKILKVTTATIHRWKKDGKIPHVRIGNNIRYRKTDLEKLVK